MSTRCNVIIRDAYGELIFYRHSDGYPEGVKPTLTKFLEWVKAGKIRDNVNQSSGWLILLGAIEYNASPGGRSEIFANALTNLIAGEAPNYWKVGSYEPTTDIHGDIRHLYVIDLTEKAIYEDGVDGFVYHGNYRP